MVLISLENNYLLSPPTPQVGVEESGAPGFPNDKEFRSLIVKFPTMRSQDKRRHAPENPKPSHPQALDP